MQQRAWWQAWGRTIWGLHPWKEMIMSARRKPAPPVLAEVPGFSYYTPAAANVPARPVPVLSALEQMYAYWSRG